jgi:hypothetical protein
MKDQRFVEMRIRAERDFSISDRAFRLICRLISSAVLDRHFMPDDSFPLSAGRVAQLVGLPRRARRNTYAPENSKAKKTRSARKIRSFDPEYARKVIYELLPTPGETYGTHRKSYLKRHLKHGCPPTWFFKFNL